MIKEAKHVHLAGAGGIGVSALAQLLKYKGKTVTGSDRVSSPVTEMLEKKGIKVSVGSEKISDGVELLVYSDALDEGNLERLDAKEKGIPQLSYFEALGEISKEYFTIAVTGTHGKTTTTGMLGKLLVDAGKDPTVIVGSIMKDFESNFRAGGSDVLVVEGCEYMGHILELNANILVLTNVEFDHPDFFKDLEDVQNTFKKAIEQLPGGGIVITNPSDKNIQPILKDFKGSVVDYTKEEIGSLAVQGTYNRFNAQAAKAAAKAFHSNVENKELDTSLSHFSGTWRRLEYKGKTKKGADVYDDYAHHPTAVDAVLNSMSDRSSGKIIVAFHPHQENRTEAFFGGFVDALSVADSIILAPIYKARAEEGSSVTSEQIVDALKERGKDAQYFDTFEEIAKELEENADENDVIITMGAGDIYRVADEIVSERG